MPFLDSDKIDYSPNPGGSTQQVQYNNDGVMDGASRVTIDDDDLVLAVSATPSAPDEDTIKIYNSSVGGRPLLSIKPEVGSLYNLQPFLGRRRVQRVTANGDGTTVTSDGTTLGTVGTATTAATATTNLHTASKRVELAVTVASTSAVAGFRTAALQHFMGTSTFGGYYLVITYGPSRGVTTATHRSFAGMWGSGSAPTDVDPSTLTDMVGFGYDDDDVNIQFMHNNASGTATKVNLGASFPKPSADTTKVYEGIIYCPAGGPDIYYQFTDLTTGVSTAVGSVASEIPASTTLVRPVVYNSVGGTNSVIGVSLMNLYLESSY